MSKFSKKFCGKSPFKHYKSDGKILNTHGHRDESGEMTYHGQSRDTGRTKSYKYTSEGLVRDSSSTGSKGF